MKKIGVFAIMAIQSLVGFAAQAQSPFDKATTQLDEAGTRAFGQNASNNLPQLIGSIIQILMGILGIFLVYIILRGGFIYMNAGGDTGEVKKAKDYLKNGIIGLVIIVLAYAITSFVLSSLNRATSGAVTP